MSLHKSLSRIEAFSGPNLAQRIAAIEATLKLLTHSQVGSLLLQYPINRDLIDSVTSIKRASAQIDVVLHAVGILISLPRILEPGEIVEAASLGAGNTGGDFDLETDRRVAEFKFIAWQGSGDAVRKKTLFEDFVKLALYQGAKRRYVYLLGLAVAKRFLNGRGSIDRLLDRNARLHRRF